MKKLLKILSILMTLCLILVVGAYASAEPSGEPSGEMAASGEPSAEPAAPQQIDTADLTASTYYTLTNYTNRDDTGNIILGYAYVDGAASDEANFQAEGNNVVLNQEVTGPAYTAVFADNSEVNVTGTLIGADNTDGQLANDFNGIGSLIIAYNGSTINVEDAHISGQGFDRSAFIVSENSVITVKNSYAEALGKNPLTEAYPEYVNSANQNIMLSPPWVLGLMGGSRVLNMIGTTPTFNCIDCELVSGGWALLSTDSGSNMMLNIIDTEMSVLPESQGGMDSGWRILGYDEDAYGSGYGAYYIGNPTQNYYGVTMNGVTYAAIITGAEAGLYTSSEGEIDIYDANGNYLETVQGKGQPTVINGVFGIMMHNSLNSGMIFNEGTTMNVEEAGIIYKAGNGDFYFDDARINVNSGVLFQMIDNDDDSRVGMISMAEGFSTEYDESKVDSGDGFPGINYDYTSGVGGNTLTATYTNGVYNGNIFNGTGYYGQKGDDLTVTLGEGAILNGDIALTSTIKGIPYSAEAIEGIAYYGDDISYILLDAEGNVTENEAEAAYIQFQSYTMNQYFLQGHVENKNYYNGSATIDVVVEAGAIWNVTGESLITGLTVAEGAIVKGFMTENADGSITIAAGAHVIPAGSYGTIEAVGGGTTIGGGLDATGALNVEAAAGAMADMQAGDASGEPSAEPVAAEEEAAGETDSFDVTVRVNGEDYAVAQIAASVEENVYTFQIGEILDAFGITLTYDEETNIAILTADMESLLAVVMAQAVAEQAAPAASEEPVVEEAAAAEPAAEETVPATDGTENQLNTLAASAQPASEAEYEAYETYLVEYLNAYTGVGDGTFDDGARAMALGELDGVSFGSDVNAFPFEMFVTQFGAMDFAAFSAQ